MIKDQYKIIGIMSGTSLDGIDLVYCNIEKNECWSFQIIMAETIPYTKEWKKKLQNATHLSENKLQDLNEKYTEYLSDVINNFIDNISDFTEIDAVCSHGHTVLHQPEKGLTLQIGNFPQIAENIRQTVVCDFRVQDVMLGGQGAPLVPIGDQLFFSDYDYCLNIGGFANVSTEKNSQRIAYDICPVNIVLNYLSEKLGFDYDSEGKIASKGTLIPEWLENLNKIAFYSQLPPKSLGLEWVQKHIFPYLNKSNHKVEDLLHTFTEHVAQQLTQNFEENSNVLITGGGAYNKYLIQRIKSLKNLEIIIPEKQLIEYKEALVFGLLGVLKLRGEINCLKSVTGAKTDHSSGVIFLYKNNNF